MTSTRPTQTPAAERIRTRASRLQGGRRFWLGPRIQAGRETLVVIGNGMAGFKLCQRLGAMAGASRFRVVVFGEEPSPAYDRVHLTRYLQGATAEQLQLAPREWYAARGIELHTGDPVVAVDRSRRAVRSASGLEVAYDRLVFASGSRPHLPVFPGHDLPRVFVYRTLEDLDRIRACAVAGGRAAVLGGGLLGVEVAQALQSLGMETWIVERGTSLLARQLPPEAGRVLLGQVERLGLRVCLNRETECIEALGSDRLLQFNTGECLRVRLVVVAAGIRPRDELARACGLELGPRGGIRVDDHLTASDPAVYAIGECASHRGACYGLAAPGMQMADLLAGNLLGKRRAFAGCDASTRLKVPGIDVATLGDFQANGDTLRWMQGGSYRQLVVREGRLLGATVIGEWPEAGRAQELVERRARLRRGERERFIRQGRLWRGTADLSVSQWPSGALVCQCMRVPRGVLSAACAAGCLTVEQLASRTGASLVCGSCRPLLAELIGAPAESARVPGSKTLGLASLGAATLVVAIFGLDSPALADSVQSQWRHWDVLWREDWAKRASGFALVSLVLVSLMFSARKRLPKFSWGAFGHWRAVHALLGVGTLGVLAAHTGFRLGHHLNLILMLNFLGLALAGSAAGAVAAWERRLGPRAGKRLRAGWTAAHIGLAWPLPALVVFHALAAYYF